MLGIRVFERGTAAEEIVMDVEISYAGDARLKFSLQNIDCEINQVPGSTGAIQLLQLAMFLQLRNPFQLIKFL